MSETIEQPKALTKDEWQALFEEQVKADGLDPETPFEDPDDDLTAQGARANIRTGAIDPRDAIVPARAAEYLRHWREQAAKGKATLPAGVVESFLRLGEEPPAPAAEDSPASKSAPAAPKKTVEEWATEKKLLPASFPRKRAAVTSGGLKGVALAGNPTEHNPHYWKFAAAKAGEGWPVGFEMTEADFDQAIANHTDLPHGA